MELLSSNITDSIDEERLVLFPTTFYLVCVGGKKKKPQITIFLVSTNLSHVLPQISIVEASDLLRWWMFFVRGHVTYLAGVAETHVRFNWSLVLTTNSHRRHTHEPTGHPESLWGKIEPTHERQVAKARPPPLRGKRPHRQQGRHLSIEEKGGEGHLWGDLGCT